MTTSATPQARPAIASGFMPLIGTTSAFFAMIGVGFVAGIGAVMTMM